MSRSGSSGVNEIACSPHGRDQQRQEDSSSRRECINPRDQGIEEFREEVDELAEQLKVFRSSLREFKDDIKQLDEDLTAFRENMKDFRRNMDKASNDVGTFRLRIRDVGH